MLQEGQGRRVQNTPGRAAGPRLTAHFAALAASGTQSSCHLVHHQIAPCKGGWVLLIGDAQLPPIQWWGSPDVGRKYSFLPAQKSDRWPYSVFYLLRAIAKLPSKTIAVVSTPIKRIWECLSLRTSPVRGTLASLIGERWEEITQAETWMISMNWPEFLPYGKDFSGPMVKELKGQTEFAGWARQVHRVGGVFPAGGAAETKTWMFIQKEGTEARLES